MRRGKRWAAAAVLILCIGWLSIGPEPTGTKLAAITFDDGPNAEWTPQVVAALDERGAKGTFFMVGSWIPTKEDLVRSMVAEGHEVANHTWEHANLTDLPPEEVYRQIELSRAKLEEVTGQKQFLLRTPFGVRTQTVRDCLGGALVLWSQDPAAGQTVAGDVMAQKVISTFKDGDIILLHDSTQNNYDAACQILDAMQPKGYDFVTVSELMRLRGITQQAGVILKRVTPNPQMQDYDESQLQEHWAWTFIQTAEQQGLMTGNDTGFHPNRPATRAEVVEALWSAAGQPAPEKNRSYLDVRSSAHYAEAVAWAKENGLLDGIVGRRFCRSTEVTREQLYVLTDRLWQVQHSGEPEGTAPLPSYGDRFRGSDWAKMSVERIEHLGFVSQNDRELLRPADDVTRAELAELAVWYAQQAE